MAIEIFIQILDIAAWPMAIVAVFYILKNKKSELDD